MNKTKEYKIDYDSAKEEMLIRIIEKVEIDGEVFTKPARVASFRKFNTDDDGVKTTNEDFNSQIDEWTGVEDFIKTRYNS